jgi:hypothetical protein
VISEQQNSTRCEPLITADRAAELLKLHPKTVKRLAQAGELPGMKIGCLAVSRIESGRMDVRTITVLQPPESERGSNPMRTRYQHGSLQLDERRNGPDVWVYRWREYLPTGKTQRRGEMIGTIEEFPTKADALKASEYLRLTANSENPRARTLSFGALLDRYMKEEMPERHSTNLAYRSYIETHIRPRWANLPLSKLVAKGAPFTVEQWLKSLDPGS